MYTVESFSQDLKTWSPPVKLTPQDPSLNYSSPGCILPWKGEYVLCLQTYCRENGEKYGNHRSRPYIMCSRDLIHWKKNRVITSER